ncbi:FAD-binding protein [Fodinicola acaciae]|uniref:FAD-binding protein n=1 Tax=Fodinicola acaciae TaxID=2681555 RepID=UPI0013D75BA3|nr:FAD-binding protein [Fodinicola acaciae]
METRRNVLAALGIGTLVAGFDPVTRAWASDGDADRVPPLEGTLHLDEPTRRADAQDAGRYLTRLPPAVLRPGSVADIQKMIRFCRRHRIPVAARGLANTTNGQGLVSGLLIENRSLAGIESIQADRAVVGAGTTWLELTKAAHERGLTPPALTGYLGLTMGGTLSLGGVPPAIQTGAQVDNVLDLEVVTGTGELVRCSATHRRDLFEAVLGGIGQFGIITRATVRLVRAPAKVRGHELTYTDQTAFFQDVRTLIRRGEISEIYGDWWRPGEHGGTVHLNAFTFYDKENPPDDAHILRGLTQSPDKAVITDDDYLPHVTRIDAAVDELRRVLDWDHRIKPWVTLWLSESTIEAYVRDVVPSLQPRDVGDAGFVLMYVHRRSKLTRPSLRLADEDGSDWVYLFTLMTSGTPGDVAFGKEMVKRNRRLYEKAYASGGRRYPIESVDFDPADWLRHYGERWPHLLALKETVDPDRLLTPGPEVFG